MRGIIVGRSSEIAPVRIDQSMLLRPMVGVGSGAGLDCVVAEINGVHSRRVNRRSFKLYYVTAGILNVSTDDGNSRLTPGDVGIVPPGLACSITGTEAHVVIVCAPPFEPEDEEIDL